MENWNNALNIIPRKEFYDHIIVIIKLNNSGRCKQDGDLRLEIFDTEGNIDTNNDSNAKTLVPTESYPVIDDKFIHLMNNGIGFESKECNRGDNENISKATNDNVRLTLCIELQSFPLSSWPNWLKSFVSTTRRLVILRVAEQLNLTELHFQPRAVFFILNVQSGRMLESQTDLGPRAMIPMTQSGPVDIGQDIEGSTCPNVPLMRRVLEERGHGAIQYILRLFTTTGYTEMASALMLCAAIGLLKRDVPLKPNEKAFWVCLRLAAEGNHPKIARSLIENVGPKKMVIRFYKAVLRHKNTMKDSFKKPKDELPSPCLQVPDTEYCFHDHPAQRNTASGLHPNRENAENDDPLIKTWRNILDHYEEKFVKCENKTRMITVGQDLQHILDIATHNWSNLGTRPIDPPPIHDPGDGPSSMMTHVSCDEHEK